MKKKLFCFQGKKRHLPTPGNGCIPGYAACGKAASPFGSPCVGIDKWSASVERKK